MTYYISNTAPMIPSTPAQMQERIKTEAVVAPAAPAAPLQSKAASSEEWKKERDELLAEGRDILERKDARIASLAKHVDDLLAELGAKDTEIEKLRAENAPGAELLADVEKLKAENAALQQTLDDATKPAPSADVPVIPAVEDPPLALDGKPADQPATEPPAPGGGSDGVPSDEP